MGLLSGLMGNASEVDDDDLEKVLANTLIEGEQIEKAYKVVRDMFIFTNKRLILLDKQGVTGSKIEMISIAYSKITKFSEESAGHFDLDAEIFFISINKNNISKGKWLKISSYDKSQLPTVMKKIVKVALVNQQ